MEAGGPFNCGTVFRVTPSGGFAIVHAFTCGVDGSGPNTALIHGRDGNLYGTTNGYDAHQGRGAIFRLNPSGDVTVLHVFAGGPQDGDAPKGLMQASDGNFYGTTFYGGRLRVGTGV